MKIGDKVYFSECPEHCWTLDEPYGTIISITKYNVTLNVENHFQEVVFEKDGGSWSLCREFKREPWEYKP